MAKGDIISRLKLESGEFDSKIKRAGQELMAYSEHCKKTGIQMGYANKDAKEFAKALGSMQTTATTARGKINELSEAFVNAKVMYNQMTDAEKQGQFGKNLAQSLDQLKQRTQEAKRELEGITKELQGGSIGGGGLFSGDKLSGMLQVFGGNLMTKGFELATGAAMGFVNTVRDAAVQGIEMAKSGEGIRIAFERLNQPGLLDNLREATHGTVTNLELMKAAVKFNDFKLPLSQLGTMLAFAQQKAKDTGQSVDYMVDSIVTGLGRQSLMILDNLGISASEVKEKMKQTGDMTTAVGEIIRKQMSQAGDYVETAADRATRADVDLKNAMEDLGRTLLPLQEQGEGMWNALTIGAINLLNDGVKPLVPAILELKDTIGGIFDALSNSTVLNGFIDWMETGIDVSTRLIPQLAQIRNLMNFGKGAVDHQGALAAGAGVGAAIVPPNLLPEVVVAPGPKPTTTTTKRTGGKINESTEDMLAKSLAKAISRIDASAIKNEQAKLDSQPSAIWQMVKDQYRLENPVMDEETRKATLKDTKEREKEAGKEIRKEQKEKKGEEKDAVEVADQMVGGINSMVSSLEGLGIEIPEGFKNMMGGLESVVGLLQSIMMIVQAIEAINEVGTFLGIFKNGGIVPHAANGMLIPGNSFSGDNLRMPVDGGRGWIGVNSGELILSKSQQNNLATELTGGGMRNMQLSAIIRGEDIRLALNNNGRRTGRGEYVQSTKRR